MEWLGFIYIFILLASILLGLIVTIKRKKVLGILQILLSIFLPIWAFIFALKRDYLSVGPEANEFYYMYTKILEGNFEAITITLLYVVLAVLFIYNFYLLIKKK